MFTFSKNKSAGFLAAALLANAAAGAAVANDEGAVMGYWVTEGKTEVVEVKACNEGSRRLCGDLVWAANGLGDDTQVLAGLRASKGNLSSGNLWNKGKFYDLEGGKKREGSIELLEDGTLKVAACNKRGLCKNQVWARPDANMASLPEHIRLASR
ncbi:MAG: DUF2147 domain-containing protein [Alphaproteobacteria bacterium]|nr:DUF2147 domain-containing protein [Alphaproteobacteria bacterium]